MRRPPSLSYASHQPSGVGDKHKFAQIYVLDVADATQRRLEIAPALRPHVLEQLHMMMLEHNHLARTFRAAASSGVPHLMWHGDSEMEAFEIGAIVARPGFNRNIVVARHDGRFQSIHASHQYYHALTYPLLFPTGCPGWHPNIPFGNGGVRTVSLPEFMRYKMMHRSVPSHVQRCERLALEYICDAQAQAEARELEFHARSTQQAKYRAASAKAIIENINSELLDVGTPVILPANFTGPFTEMRVTCAFWLQTIRFSQVLPSVVFRCDGFASPFWQTGPIHYYDLQPRLD